MADCITFGSPQLQEGFFKRFRKATGGQGRLIKFGLEAMCRKERVVKLNSESDIDNAIKDAFLVISEKVKGQIDLVESERASFNDPDFQRIFFKLAFCAAASIPLSNDAKITIHGRERPLRDIANRFGFAEVNTDPTRSSNSDSFLLEASGWLICCWQKKTHQSEWRLPMVEVSNYLQNPEVVDRGELLEVITRCTISYQLAVALATKKYSCWGELFPFLGGSVVGDVQLSPLNRVNLPKFVRPSDERKEWNSDDIDTFVSTNEVIDSKVTSARSWDPLIIGSKLFPHGSLLGVPSQKSHSEDLAILLPPILAFQIKNNIDPLTWSIIREEIEKTQYSCKPGVPVCFVILALTLGSELTQAIESGNATFLRLPPGCWYYDKKAKKLSQQKGSQDSVFTVPPGMELVLLSKAAVESFLGENNFWVLRNFAEQRHLVGAELPSLALDFQHLFESTESQAVSSFPQGVLPPSAGPTRGRILNSSHQQPFPLTLFLFYFADPQEVNIRRLGKTRGGILIEMPVYLTTEEEEKEF